MVSYTLPKTNKVHLKMDGWNTIVSFLGFGSFSGFSGALLVSGRGILYFHPEIWGRWTHFDLRIFFTTGWNSSTNQWLGRKTKMVHRLDLIGNQIGSWWKWLHFCKYWDIGLHFTCLFCKTNCWTGWYASFKPLKVGFTQPYPDPLKRWIHLWPKVDKTQVNVLHLQRIRWEYLGFLGVSSSIYHLSHIIVCIYICSI